MCDETPGHHEKAGLLLHILVLHPLQKQDSKSINWLCIVSKFFIQSSVSNSKTLDNDKVHWKYIIIPFYNRGYKVKTMQPISF